MQYHKKKLHLHNLKICRMIILMNFSRGLSIWPGVMCRGCRPLSGHQGITEVMSVAELSRGGGVTQRSLTTEDIIMRRNTTITTTMSTENMVMMVTMRVRLQPKRENMNKLPNGLFGY